MNDNSYGKLSILLSGNLSLNSHPERSVQISGMPGDNGELLWMRSDYFVRRMDQVKYYSKMKQKLERMINSRLHIGTER